MIDTHPIRFHEAITDGTGKRQAKIAAAQVVVAELLGRQLIDNLYNPKSAADCTVEGEDGDFEADSKDRQDWTYRSPDFWKRCSSTNMHLTRVHTNRLGTMRFADLLILTKDASLPALPLLMFYNKDEIFSISCKNLAGSVSLSAAQLAVLTGFTDRLLKVMINKKFQGTPSDHVRNSPKCPTSE